MPTDDRKKIVTMRAATLIVCFVCLAGLCVFAAYLVARFEYNKQLAVRDRRIGAMRKSEKALAGRNIQLLHSLRKMENEYGRLYMAKAEANRPALKQQPQGPGREHEASGQEHRASGQKRRVPGKGKPPGETVLGPTWVGAGKASTLFGGELRIVLRQPSARDMCRKGSVVSSISSAEGNQKLCLSTGAPAKFTYRGRTYRVNLSGIAGRGEVYHYYISISR